MEYCLRSISYDAMTEILSANDFNIARMSYGLE